MRKETETADAVGFLVVKNGRFTGEADFLNGAYGENVEALAARMNAARERALGPGTGAVSRRRPGSPGTSPHLVARRADDRP